MSDTIKKPETLRERIEAVLSSICNIPEYALERYKCMDIRKWLEYKMFFKGGHHFRLYFGENRKILNHCRRMCRGAQRRYVLGIVVTKKDGRESIRMKIENCLRTIWTAFLDGKKSEPEEVVMYEETFADFSREMNPSRELIRCGFRFAT